MQRKVIHLMRKFFPITTTFIRNQVLYQDRYLPSIVYTENYHTALRKDITDRYNSFRAISPGIGEVIYQYLRILLPKDQERLIKHIKDIQPEILHLHYGVDALVFSGILEKVEIPAVVSFYGYDCTSFPKMLMGFGKTLLRKKVFSHPSIKKVLAMSPDMKEDLIQLGCPPNKIIVHYYGTETAPFNIKTQNSYRDIINFVIISGFHEKKGHRFLMEAFYAAHNASSKKIHLHIVGEGPLREEINKIKSDLNCEAITVHGPVEYGSVEHLHFLNMADVFVHPSVTPKNGDKEGIPGSIIEAMAAGIPVIATEHAGIPYIIKSGISGILVKEYDNEALTKAILKLASDQALRRQMGNAGNDYALKELDIQTKEAELENIYDAVINDRY